MSQSRSDEKEIGGEVGRFETGFSTPSIDQDADLSQRDRDDEKGVP
jgi:hypothetical protein